MLPLFSIRCLGVHSFLYDVHLLTQQNMKLNSISGSHLEDITTTGTLLLSGILKNKTFAKFGTILNVMSLVFRLLDGQVKIFEDSL